MPWFLIPLAVFILIGEELYLLAVVGAVVVLIVDYRAMVAKRWIPVATVGLILAILVSYYFVYGGTIQI